MMALSEDEISNFKSDREERRKLAKSGALVKIRLYASLYVSVKKHLLP